MYGQIWWKIEQVRYGPGAWRGFCRVFIFCLRYKQIKNNCMDFYSGNGGLLQIHSWKKNLLGFVYFRLSIITVCLCFLLSLTGGHAARVEWEWRLPAFLAASTGLHLLLRQEDAPWSLGKSLQVFQTCRCLLGFQSHLIVSSDCALNNTDCGESGQNLEWLIVFLLSALWLKDSSSWREAEGGEGGGTGCDTAVCCKDDGYF